MRVQRSRAVLRSSSSTYAQCLLFTLGVRLGLSVSLYEAALDAQINSQLLRIVPRIEGDSILMIFWFEKFIIWMDKSLESAFRVYHFKFSLSFFLSKIYSLEKYSILD